MRSPTIPHYLPHQSVSMPLKVDFSKYLAKAMEAQPPELSAPPWSLELPASLWSLELSAPPWSLKLPAPPWSLELPELSWALELPAPLWHPELRHHLGSLNCQRHLGSLKCQCHPGGVLACQVHPCSTTQVCPCPMAQAHPCLAQVLVLFPCTGLAHHPSPKSASDPPPSWTVLFCFMLGFGSCP